MAGSGGALRHVVKRRVHLERATPSNRRGKTRFVERHKDYIQRAAAHHARSNTLKTLQEKARQRNPQEFHFNMINCRLDAKGRCLVVDKAPSVKQLLESNAQDRSIVQLKSNTNRLGRDRNHSNLLHHLEGPKINTHVIFSETDESHQRPSEITPAASEREPLSSTAPDDPSASQKLQSVRNLVQLSMAAASNVKQEEPHLRNPTRSLRTPAHSVDQRLVEETVEKSKRVARQLARTYETAVQSSRTVAKLEKALRILETQRDLKSLKKGAVVKKVKWSNSNTTCDKLKTAYFFRPRRKR